MTPKTLQNNKTNLPFLFMDVLHSMFQYFFLKKSNNPFQSVSRDFSISNPVSSLTKIDSSLITSCYRIAESVSVSDTDTDSARKQVILENAVTSISDINKEMKQPHHT